MKLERIVIENQLQGALQLLQGGVLSRNDYTLLHNQFTVDKHKSVAVQLSNGRHIKFETSIDVLDDVMHATLNVIDEEDNVIASQVAVLNISTPYDSYSEFIVRDQSYDVLPIINYIVEHYEELITEYNVGGFY